MEQPPVAEPDWPVSIAVDVGGTFTDLVMVDAAGATSVTKVPSVPADPSRGVLDALARLAADLGLSVDRILPDCSTMPSATIRT